MKAIKLYAPKLLASRNQYEAEMGAHRGSVYIEDGELEETQFAHIQLLDMEGRYVASDLGYFPVLPEHFDCMIYEARDGRSWYDYRINAAGIDYFRTTFKIYPDRVTLVVEAEILEKMDRMERAAAALLEGANKIKKLLKR